MLNQAPTNQVARITFWVLLCYLSLYAVQQGFTAVGSLTTLVEGYAPHLRMRIKLFKKGDDKRVLPCIVFAVYSR